MGLCLVFFYFPGFVAVFFTAATQQIQLKKKKIKAQTSTEKSFFLCFVCVCVFCLLQLCGDKKEKGCFFSLKSLQNNQEKILKKNESFLKSNKRGVPSILVADTFKSSHFFYPN